MFRFSVSRALFTAVLVVFGFLVGNAQQGSQTVAGVPAAEAFRVWPEHGAGGPEVTPYLLYQTRLAWEQDALRRSSWAGVKTEGDLLALRSELKKSVLEMIGGLPAEKAELHATITGRIQGQGFHIEKLLFQSLPGLYITALVYVPENGEKVHPAVLVPAGHAPNGKIHYQELCQRLVQRGYLVISWDPIGQGERSQFWNAAEKKSRYNLVCAEHGVLGNLAYLAGTNLARWEVWDGMRAVDYLLTRADVDPKRINLTGTSGGGFQTAILGALDDRIQVVIPSCYITALPMRVSNRIFADPDSDPEQDLYGFLSKGVDHAGLLLMMYPRRVMVATATLDFFPVQGSYESYSEVRTLYDRFGHSDRIGFAESYNKHQYSLKNQESALAFLDRFNQMPVRHGLPSVTTWKDEDLLVTPSGQVSVDVAGARMLPYYIAKYAEEHKRDNHPTMAQLYADHAPAIATWKVGSFDGSVAADELRYEAVGNTTVGSVHIDRYILHHSVNLQMPLLHIYGAAKSKGSLLWVSMQGKVTEKDWAQITKLIADGYEIFSFDFRGDGETRMNYSVSSPDDPSLGQEDPEHADSNPLLSVLADFTYNSLLTGRSYFLQRMDDIKIAELFIRNREPRQNLPLTIYATGDAYNLASRYAAMNSQIKLVQQNNAKRIDWSAIVSQEQEQWPIVDLMPSGAYIH